MTEEIINADRIAKRQSFDTCSPHGDLERDRLLHHRNRSVPDLTVFPASPKAKSWELPKYTKPVETEAA
jgi:hypothetical protein